MAKSFSDARDAADARLEEAVAPFARELARKAGAKEPKNARDRAERRLQESDGDGKAERIVKQLRGLSKAELQRVAEAANELLDDAR